MNFTIVIPSRNRPVLLRKAIDSVLMQTHGSFEVIVVNDGSDANHAEAYARMAAELAGKVRFLDLEQAPNGHGQSGSINRGVALASGEYVGFLDDDDYWTDPDHLERASRCIQSHGGAIDVYFSNQRAYLNDALAPGPIWLEPLGERLPARGPADNAGSYAVALPDLMACSGFGHLNTTLVRRALFERIGGMDENIRYECDLDFYLRTIDAASTIRFFPGYVSRHNAPDPAKALNMSTVVSFSQKMLARAYVWDKALLAARAPVIRNTALRSKAYTYKKMAHALAGEGRYKAGFYYARAALPGGTNPKWLAYCAYLALRAGFRSSECEHA